MKGLLTLIKLSKRALDELRRKMGALENQKSQFEFAAQKLQEELQHEIVMAKKQPEMSGFFGDFAKRIKKRQEVIAGEIRKLDQQIEKMRDEIATAFGELKKYEIALENSKQRAKDAQNRKDTIQLDEIASQQYQRRQETQES